MLICKESGAGHNGGVFNLELCIVLRNFICLLELEDYLKFCFQEVWSEIRLGYPSISSGGLFCDGLHDSSGLERTARVGLVTEGSKLRTNEYIWYLVQLSHSKRQPLSIMDHACVYCWLFHFKYSIRLFLLNTP